MSSPSARWLNITWPDRVRRSRRHAQRRGHLPHGVRARRVLRTGWACTAATCSARPCCRHGTPEQKARFLPKITAVEEIWGQGFSEPDAGSDLAGLRTRATRDGDEWVIDGQKIWMTFGMYADWLYVLCRTDRDAPKHRGISLIMVPARPARRRRPPDPQHRRRRGVLRGVLHRRPHRRRSRRRPGRRRLAGRDGNARHRARLGDARHRSSGSTRRWTTCWRWSAGEVSDADAVVRQRLADAWIGLQVNRYNNYRALTALDARRRARAGVVDLEAVLGELAPRLRRADGRPARRRTRCSSATTTRSTSSSGCS